MSRLLASTPAADGYAMPAEWAPQAQVWLLWPERPDNWRFGAKPAQAALTELIHAIAEHTPVTLGVSAEQFENACARVELREADAESGSQPIRVVELAANDAWARDVGPSFVVDGDGAVRAVDWEFNAWGGLQGGLYQPWNRDDQVTEKICRIERIDRYRSKGFVLEGGAVHVDGDGTLLTTAECLLHPNRNPHLSQAQIEQQLHAYLGTRKALWLPLGLVNDETDGHIDNMACFLEPGVVLLAWTDDETDPQYPRSRRALEYLQAQTDARGRRLRVHLLPLPTPLVQTESEAQGIDVARNAWPRRAGARMAASYINFLISNGGVLLPRFDDRRDEEAANRLADLLPRHRVTTIACREILLGGGNIHCMTCQQPTG